MSYKWQDIKRTKYQEFDFGPQTPAEEVIFAEEAARVDREVAEYQGTLLCRYNQTKECLRSWYHHQLDRDGLVHDVDRWCYLRARSVKLLYQRLTRGWDDSITWNLDHELAKLILPRLRRFKELTHGWPGPEHGVETFEDWQVILGKMIYSFEIISREDIEPYEIGGKECEDKVNEGIMLFGKWYRALWD